MAREESGMQPGAGFHRPAGLRFVQLDRGMLLGDSYCSAGDVVAVEPPESRPAAIMPVDPRLFPGRAQQLIDRRQAHPHHGPATVQLGKSLVRPDERPSPADVERAVNPAHRRADRAVAAPQRGAM